MKLEVGVQGEKMWAGIHQDILVNYCRLISLRGLSPASQRTFKDFTMCTSSAAHP